MVLFFPKGLVKNYGEGACAGGYKKGEIAGVRNILHPPILYHLPPRN